METHSQENVVQSALYEARKPMTSVDGEFLYVPKGYDVKDLAEFKPSPRRATGYATLQDQTSFIEYVKSLATRETRLYCDLNLATATANFKALFNDHRQQHGSPGTTEAEGSQERTFPGWKDYGATYTPAVAPEWDRWVKSSAQGKDQIAFASFLEQNIQDITTSESMPSGAALLEMAKSLEISRDYRLSSQIRQESGSVELTFINRDDENTVKKMEAFKRFAIGVPIFVNGSPYKVEAWLRWRADPQGKATFWYELDRPEITVRAALKDIVSAIATGTGMPVLFGKV